MYRILACYLLTFGFASADFLVTSAVDSGPGTLRQAFTDAAASPSADIITFDPDIFTGATPTTNTIILASAITVNDPDGVTVDGSAISSGITISGGGTTRLFLNSADSYLTFESLSLTAALAPGDNGGAIRNLGVLDLYRCCLHGNSASAAAGAAIASTGTGNLLFLENCTIAGNTAGAGAIHISATEFSALIHCTVSQNHGTTATGGCGGLVLNTGSVVVLQNTIIAGNTAAGTSPPDVNGGTTNFLFMEGVNLIGVRSGGLQDQLAAGLPNASGHFIGTSAAPVPAGLGVLAKTRGPTLALAPLAGSLAIDRIAATPISSDQSGQPRVDHGLADIGAMEARLVFAEAAWDVRFSWKAGVSTGSAAEAGFNFSIPGVTHRAYTSDVIAFRDDAQTSENQGYFTHRQRLWPINNQTPQGLLDGDDDEFYMHARTHIAITEEDDYTFGFASDDGARLRLFRTDGSADPIFLSSTPLNPDHPTPVHLGNTLTHDGGTSSSDTLGVVHLTPGTYLIEFDYIEGGGFSHAEVFAARGAKTAVDGSFRLIGDRAAPLSLAPPALTPAGWAVQVFRNNSTSLAEAITASYDANAGTFLPSEIMSLRFTTSADHPERDPMTYKLEGALIPGNWVTIATGNTQLPVARLTAGPLIPLDNVARYRELRITFPTVRDAATATAMQIGEAALFTAFGSRFGTSLSPGTVPAATLAANGPEYAQDGDPATAYVHPAVMNAGFTLIPGFASSSSLALATSSTLHFHDPENYEEDTGHGLTPAPYPGDLDSEDDNFASVSRAVLSITAEGDYTFCAEASQNVRLRIIGSRGWRVAHAGSGTPTALLDGFQCLDTAGDVLGQVHLRPGNYEIEVFQHDAVGPAVFGLWVASGRQERFDPQNARFFSLLSSVPPAPASESPVPFAFARSPGHTSPVNDDFSRALTLHGTDTIAFGGNTDATLETNETNIFSTTRSVWWKWTASASGPMQIETFGSAQETTVSLLTGTAVNALTFLDGRYYSDINGQAAFPFIATAGTTYYFQISVFSSQSPGLLRIHLGPANNPPNNDFAIALDLGNASPVVATGNILNAWAEDDEPSYPNGSFSTANVWYRWTAPVTGKYLIETRGSGFSGTHGVFTGNTLATLAIPSQTTGSADGTDYTLLNATAGTTYAIAVDVGFSGSDPSYCLNIAHVGRHEVSDPVINEDDSTYMVTYLGDTANQRTLRFTPASSNPALLPGVEFADLATITIAEITPAADQFGNVTYTQSTTFDRIPATLAFSLTVNPVNDAPAFSSGPAITTGNSASFTQNNWASAITAGPANEAAQTLQFSITGNTNPGLFLSPIVVSVSGALSFVPNPDVTGSSTITLQLRDNGGTANGGVDFFNRTFTVTTVTAYSAWATTQFGSATLLTEPQDDFDQDGISNLLEFMLGENPLAATPNSLTETTLDATHLTLQFNRNDDSEGAHTLSVQTSPDLTTWTSHTIGSSSSTSASINITVSENGSAEDEIIVKISRNSQSRLFARLKGE